MVVIVKETDIYLPIIMFTISFILAPFPTCPRKNDLFPKTSKAGIDSSKSDFKQDKIITAFREYLNAGIVIAPTKSN